MHEGEQWLSDSVMEARRSRTVRYTPVIASASEVVSWLGRTSVTRSPAPHRVLTECPLVDPRHKTLGVGVHHGIAAASASRRIA